MKVKNRENLLTAIVVIGVVVYLAFVLAENLIFADRFGLNAKIAGVPVGLKTQREAEKILQAETDKYRQSQIQIGKKSYPAADLIGSFDVSRSVEEAVAIQKQDFWQLSTLRTQAFSLSGKFNDKKIQAILMKEYDDWSEAPQDATIDLEGNRVIAEKPGQKLLLAESRAHIENDLLELHKQSGLVVKSQKPIVSTDVARSLIAEANQATAEPLRLISDRGEFDISQNQLRSWLKLAPFTPRTVVLRDTVAPEVSEYYFFDRSKVDDYIRQMAVNIDQPTVNAQLTFSNGSVRVSRADQTGYQLDRADTEQQILNSFGDNRTIKLKVDEKPAEVRADNLPELGITELISTGQSDFRGSPVNRIHNVTNGASKFNGVLVKPGEKFSFNTTLGPVEKSTGYLPELVILENKTAPQYGGGLCQVSSTAFRAALNAGFPILERRMHAYPVSYYKPFGVDATIYLPKPDMIFRNDSGHYVLIQTRISGTKLYFDFYGTKPARTVKFAGNTKAAGASTVVEQVDPAIYDLGLRGKRSFTAAFYRFIYDASNKLVRMDTFVSKYDSPDKYPH